MTRIAPRVTDVRLVPAARIWRYDQTMIVLVEDIFYIWSLHFSSFFIFRFGDDRRTSVESDQLVTTSVQRVRDREGTRGVAPRMRSGTLSVTAVTRRRSCYRRMRVSRM